MKCRFASCMSWQGPFLKVKLKYFKSIRKCDVASPFFISLKCTIFTTWTNCTNGKPCFTTCTSHTTWIIAIMNYITTITIPGHPQASSWNDGTSYFFGQEITSRAYNPLGTYSCQTSSKCALEVISFPKILLTRKSDIVLTCSPWVSEDGLDCEQSLFSSKIRGKERKTGKGASVTVSVIWEWWCHQLLVAWALGDEWKERLHWFHTTIWMLLWQVTSMTARPFWNIVGFRCKAGVRISWVYWFA